MLGFGALARKIFGSPNDRTVKAVRPLVAQINALEPEFKASGRISSSVAPLATRAFNSSVLSIRP